MRERGTGKALGSLGREAGRTFRIPATLLIKSDARERRQIPRRKLSMSREQRGQEQSSKPRLHLRTLDRKIDRRSRFRPWHMICGEQKKGFGGARSLNGWDVSGGARMACGHAGYGGADGCPAVGCRASRQRTYGTPALSPASKGSIDRVSGRD